MDSNLKIQGEYLFYDQDKCIVSKNILTKYGKRYLTQYLAGQGNSFQKDIAIGVGSTAATDNDTQLGFEFYRAAVNISSVDITTNPITGVSTYAVVYKTTLPVDVAGTINEIGLFPNKTLGSTDYYSSTISLFGNSQFWVDSSGQSATSVSTPTPNIGIDYTSVTAALGQTKEYFYDLSFDISGYSSNDSFTVAYYQSDLDLDYIFIRTYDSDNNYYEIRYPSESTTGYKVKSLTLDNLYTSGFGSGSPDGSSIVKISIGAKAKSSGPATVLFDGLRVNDEDTFQSDYGLISRSVLSTPIVKQLGKQMDIEYKLGLTF